MTINESYYKRDLVARQNKSLTSAQLYDISITKRYSNEEIENYFKGEFRMDDIIKNKNNNTKQIIQKDLNGNTVDENLLIKKDESKAETNNLVKDINSNVSTESINSFIYNNRLILFDNNKGSLKLRYKVDLFNNIITEFQKIYNWLDTRASTLQFISEEEIRVEITADEIKNTIDCLIKLNSIKIDKDD